MLIPKSAGTVLLAAVAATLYATSAAAAPPPPPPCPGGFVGCPPPGGGPGVPPPPAPQPPPPDQVAQGLRAALAPPPPVVHTTPNSPTYVQLKTSFWIGPGVWQNFGAGPQTQQGQTVTVTATPDNLLWDFGDGGTLTCYGPGSPSDTTNCVHTYQRSSANQAGGVYPLAATMTWKVTWTCAGNCLGLNGGNLAAIQMTGNAPLKVGEIQGTNN